MLRLEALVVGRTVGPFPDHTVALGSAASQRALLDGALLPRPAETTGATAAAAAAVAKSLELQVQEEEQSAAQLTSVSRLGQRARAASHGRDRCPPHGQWPDRAQTLSDVPTRPPSPYEAA